MATPKTINVTDVQLGRLYISPLDDDGFVLVQRDYRLVGDDPLLATLNHQILTRSVLFSSLPQNIRDALILINDYTYAQALADQGMSD